MFITETHDLERVITVAQKEEPADIVLKNARIVNVFSGEIYSSEVVIAEGLIAALGAGYQGTQELDMDGKIVCPGFIDGHMHLESSMVPVPEFSWNVVPHGTTAIVIDPHEIANIMGMTGISYILKTSKYNPVSVYVMLPSCVPATPMETAGAELKALDLFPLLQDKWVLGLGEVMNYPGVLACREDVMDKLKIASGRIIDGHAPGLLGDKLNAYVAAGIGSDHECTTVEEAMEKLRLGMYIMIREGSTTKNLADLLPLITEQTRHRCIFVTDDRNPAELMDQGHIDHMVRKSISLGLNPIWAIQCATINTANYFGLKHLGAIAPGRSADLIVLSDLETVQIDKVFKNGICVAENGNSIYKKHSYSEILMRSSVNVKWIEREQFQVKAESNQLRVIEIIPDQIVTKSRVVSDPKTRNGYLISDSSRDLLKMCVVERHYGSGNTGIGIVKGFGLKRGAIASSIAHDSHNIIAVGVDDEDIYQAVVQVVRQQGGLSLSIDGKIVENLPLPIGGLMADESLPAVRERLDSLVHKIHEIGCTLEHPFMTLSFMALPVIPELKLTDKGLFDSKSFAFTNLFVD